MWDGINCRKFPRFKNRIEAQLALDGNVENVSTFTENIGVGGVSLIMEKKVEKFEKIKIRLTLDDELPAIECIGRVVWLVEKRAFQTPRSNFDVGIEFLDISKVDTERIRAYISSNQPIGG